MSIARLPLAVVIALLIYGCAMPVSRVGAPVDSTTQDAADAQACLRRSSALGPATLRPPTNVAGLYAVKGACQGCRIGWWRTTEPIPIYPEPGDTGPPIATLPAETWAYVREALTLTKPTPGVVLRSGRQFKACERVYHVHTDYDEGEVSETVWRQGELLTYSPDDSDVAIAWLEEMAFVDRDHAGWWVRLEGSGGGAGWAWASERASEFQCKWERDPEDICATAPKAPPPRR